MGGISCHVRGGGSLSPLLFCCTSLLNSCSDEQFAVPQPWCYDSVILSSSQILRLFVFFSFSRGSTQKQPPILTSKGPAKNSNEKSSISVRQVKGAFSLPTATLPAALYVTSFVDLWRPAAHVAADHNKFRGGVGGAPSCQRNAWEYLIHSISHSHASSPSTQSSLHSPILSSESFFFPPQICDVGGLANAARGLSQIPNLARVEVSEGSSKI